MNGVRKVPFGRNTGDAFFRGLDLFNEQRFWEAHEAFEDVWRGQDGETKKLAQGFVQAAAALSYIEKRRYESILYLLDKSVEKLALTGSLLHNVDVALLIDSLKRIKEEVLQLGEEGLENFDSTLYPRLEARRRGPREESS